MYKIKNNMERIMSFRDTIGVLIKIEPKEEITVKYPPRNGFGKKLTIEEINKEKKTKEVKENGNA